MKDKSIEYIMFSMYKDLTYVFWREEAAKFVYQKYYSTDFDNIDNTIDEETNRKSIDKALNNNKNKVTVVKNIIKKYISQAVKVSSKQSMMSNKKPIYVSDEMISKINFNELIAQSKKQRSEHVIIGSVKPQWFIALTLYLTHHKIYDEELFTAFSEMVGIKLDDPPYFRLNFMTFAEKLIKEVKNSIAEDLNNKPEECKLYKAVFADILNISKVFRSFKAYIPEKDELKLILEEVYNELTWNPYGEIYKNNVPPSLIKEYMESCIKLVKGKVIVILSTDYKKVKDSSPDEPNDRSIRRNSPKLTTRLTLYTMKKSKIRKLCSCPKFLIEEFRQCFMNYEKNDKTKLIDKNNLIIKGRAYIIVLLIYAFDPQNYMEVNDKTSDNDKINAFKDVLKNSIGSPIQSVVDFLMIYKYLAKDEKDKKLISEILEKNHKDIVNI